MKKNYFLLMGLTVLLISFNACKKDDPAKDPITSTTELTAKNVTTAPTIDGVIDAAWDACDKLTGTATVPNLANDFKWFVGESYSFTMRSMYDASNLYMLIEYNDATKSIDRQSWYFDSATKLWKQHNKKPTSATDKYYEDKFAFLWPTASTPAVAWQTTTCYNTCHSVPAGKGFDTENKHFTNSASEVVDQWHFKLVRTGPGNQLDDQMQIYIDPNNPLAAGSNGDQRLEGGRSSDPKTAGGVSDNKQTLNNGTADVSVPKYVIPGKTGYSVITKSEIDAGTAKQITAVDVNGLLTYTGGTIDPTDAGYVPATGAKRFPSILFNGALEGSRGDVMTFANHTGTGWVIEIKRALKTSDVINDVQWDTTKEYMFGFAIFENSAVAHGIIPNLKLKFSN